MLKFSLKNLYDDKMAGYIFLIDLCKWCSIIAIFLGIFLTFWFNNYWLAIIGGVLLIIIGLIMSLITHFIKKKLTILVNIGGGLVEGAENYLVNKAKSKANKLLSKQKDKIGK